MEPRFRLQQLQWQTNMADCRAVKINIDIRIGDSDNCVEHFTHISENEQARGGGGGGGGAEVQVGYRRNAGVNVNVFEKGRFSALSRNMSNKLFQLMQRANLREKLKRHQTCMWT